MERMLLTVSEVAELIHTNKNYVYSLIKKGILPALKMGNYKVRPVDLEKFIEDHIGMNISDPNNIRELD